MTAFEIGGKGEEVGQHHKKVDLPVEERRRAGSACVKGVGWRKEMVFRGSWPSRKRKGGRRGDATRVAEERC